MNLTRRNFIKVATVAAVAPLVGFEPTPQPIDKYRINGGEWIKAAFIDVVPVRNPYLDQHYHVFIYSANPIAIPCNCKVEFVTWDEPEKIVVTNPPYTANFHKIVGDNKIEFYQSLFFM